MLMGACQSREPYVGVIVLDTDLPILHDGVLPIGVTLDPGSGGRDLLSNNMLINGDFELATKLEGLAYDYATQEVITPNGTRLHYPLPEQHIGWVFIGGSVSLAGGEDNHYVSISVSSADSLVALAQSIEGFSLDASTEYTFSCQVQGYGSGTLYASLVNDSLQLLSNRVAIAPSADWQTFNGAITTNRASNHVRLLLQLELNNHESAVAQYDSLHYWTSSKRALVLIDDLRMSPSKRVMKSGISADLYTLLDSISLAFLRYPSGATANGLYPGTYPSHIDSVRHPSLWTLRKNELTGAFKYRDLLNLARELKTSPIIVSNFGFTDPSTIQRVEDIKLLPDRINYINYLIEQAGATKITVQPGYNLTSAEYDRRFTELLRSLEQEHPELQIVSAGDPSAYQRYSDYSYDLALPEVRYDNLEEINSLLLGTDQLLYPKMVSEVYFNNNYTEGYFLPPLALRAAFLILAERHTKTIKALGICPLLSTDLERDFPIIQVVGGDYRPTQLYDFLKDFIAYRGSSLRRWEDPVTLSSDIVLSLTSDTATGDYYLKAVNMTRHPLNYQIKLKGHESDFSQVKIISYTSKQPSTSSNLEGFTHYERSVKDEKVGIQSSLTYLFAPYEVVLFRFQP